MPTAKSVLALAALLPALCLALPAPARADRTSRVTPVVRVVRMVGPAVVNIYTHGRRSELFSTGDPRDRFFEGGRPPRRRGNSLGTGVIIDGQRGLIVTNSHVIAQAGLVQVRLIDRRTFKAQVVGSDPATDLAVLRIKTKERLPQVRLGNSDDLMIGESVIAIGNPFGLSHTVTTGVLSAVRRKVKAGRTQYLGLLQTDASINPGNSGGPLLNTDGELIGINTAVRRRAQGIGFAIPVNRVKRIVFDLARYRQVIPAWLGMHLRGMTLRLADYYGLPRPEGAVVMGVMSGSPANLAGLKRGDVIVRFNGQKIENVWGYGNYLDQVMVGEKVELTVFTGKAKRKVTLKAKAFPLSRARDLAWHRLGFVVATMDEDSAFEHQVRMGKAVKVIRVRHGSRAEAIGLRPGDLILRVGQKPTQSVDAFHRQVARSRLLPRVTVLVRRGRYYQYVNFGG